MSTLSYATKFLRIVAACSAALMAAPTSSDAKKLKEFDAGPWYGEVYGDDNGTFGSCIGNASYRSGIDLSVIVHRDYSWTTLLWNEKWYWPDQKGVTAKYRFNGGAWMDITANTDGKGVFLIIPDNSTSVQLFKHSRDMDIRLQSENIGFNLTKTNNLMSILGECVDTELAAEGNANTPSTTTSNGSSSSNPGDSASQPKNSSSSGTGFFVSQQGHIIVPMHSASPWPPRSWPRAWEGLLRSMFSGRQDAAATHHPNFDPQLSSAIQSQNLTKPGSAGNDPT